jgi:hypothetical protein
MSSHAVKNISNHVYTKYSGCLLEYALKGVQLILPTPVEFQTHLDTPENHFLASLEVDTKLYNVAIIDGKCLTFLGRGAETDVVQKGAAGTLYILNVPLAILVPKFAVSATDDLALESDGGSRGLISRGVGHGVAIALGITTNSNLFVAGGERPGDGGESKRRAGGSRVVVCREPN